MTDFSKHNEEARQVWKSYHAGKPIRVPVGNFTIGPRIWVLNPKLNTTGITWEKFSTDPEVMFHALLQYKYYLHHQIVHDIEMGIPSDGWEIFTEFVNVAEAAWLGCEIFYPPGQVTVSRPRFSGDRKNEIFARGIPESFSGIMGTIREFYEYFLDRARSFEFHGKGVKVALPGHALEMNGPLTLAVDLRGEEIFCDMVEDEEYFHRLMAFIVDAKIARIRAWREYLGSNSQSRHDVSPHASIGWALPTTPDGEQCPPCESGPEHEGEGEDVCAPFADDAIQMISTAQLIEHVIPHQKRLLHELYGEGPHFMHICGNVQRHFPTLIRKLNIETFDTGFPINFSTLRDEIGEKIHILGGVRISTLLSGTPVQVREETRRILQSGVCRGGRFILKEANNMPPGTPEDNIRAMHEAAKEFGRYA